MNSMADKNEHDQPLILFNDVWKYYNDGSAGIAALRSVDFVLREGELVAVWGPSGSGKSTLCNLAGLIDEPCRGELLFNGVPVSELTDSQRSEKRNQTIGLVFQRFNLVPVLSALENVMLPLQIRGLPYSRAQARAASVLDEVGLGGMLDNRPDKLSGGQQQRVAIARALVNNPLLIVADEPTANLDTENAEKIISLMKKTGRSRNATFLFSTHDERLLSHVKRRVRLQDGSITQDETHRDQ